MTAMQYAEKLIANKEQEKRFLMMSSETSS